MRACATKCMEGNKKCPLEKCRYWIDWESDSNCALVAIEKHGAMTLREVGDRLGVSFVRIKQIEDKTKLKVYKRLLKEDITSAACVLPE